MKSMGTGMPACFKWHKRRKTAGAVFEALLRVPHPSHKPAYSPAWQTNCHTLSGPCRAMASCFHGFVAYSCFISNLQKWHLTTDYKNLKIKPLQEQKVYNQMASFWFSDFVLCCKAFLFIFESYICVGPHKYRVYETCLYSFGFRF